MPDECEVVVAGLGAMGSAAVDHLAGADVDVVGLDPHDPPHPKGSHHGNTRVLRTAYFEHPTYVPWVQRAYELWADLEEDAGEQLFVRTGGLHVSTPEGRQARDAKYAVEAHDLTADELTAAQLSRRFPAFQPPADVEAVYSPDAGFLWAKRCIRAQLDRARDRGARLATEEPLVDWGSTPGGVHVRTSERTIEADALVLAVGPWLPEIAPELPVDLEVERQVQFVFEPVDNPAHFEPGNLPVFACDGAPGQVFYGIPRPDGTVKVAAHHGGETTTADAVDRRVTDPDEAKVRGFLEANLPDLDGPVRETMVCLYTNTPDHHFLMDFHPRHRDVMVVSACSGHGFKFAPAIGEGVKDLVVHGRPRQECSLFRLGRFEVPQTER